MGHDVRRSEDHPEPGDRLGRIGERLTEVFEADPERREGERLMVLLSPAESGERGAIVLCGYEVEAQAKTDLTIQLKALHEVGGQAVDVVVVDA